MNSFENNQLIAEFLGFQSTDIGWYDAEETLSEIEKYGNTFDNYDLRFDFDWNWLMEVVEEIFSEECIKPFAGNGMYYVLELKIEEALKKAKIEPVYNACVEFIKWHNSQTN